MISTPPQVHSGGMDRKAIIEQRLAAAFAPMHLEVVDESHMHAVPAGAQSHFKVIVVSQAFENASPIERHRRVNQVLADLLAGGVHALALHTHTPAEWGEKEERIIDSPPCLGGGNAR